jgi:phosphate transport system permease protein
VKNRDEKMSKTVKKDTPAPHVHTGQNGISLKDQEVQKRIKSRKLADFAVRTALFFCAIFAVIAIFFIFIFLLKDGYSIFQDHGYYFITGTDWAPWKEVPHYGTYPLVVGTLLVTFGALLFAVPLSIGTAIFIAEIAPYKLKMVLKPSIEILSGIPSVVFGFFGLLVLVPWLATTFHQPAGMSWLAASLLLGIMAIPTITSVTEDALSSVPREFREGSLALGATKWQTISKVVVPSSLSGITAAIILGMGRAVGETMAVIMVAGNAAVIPNPITNVWSPIRTITATLGIETGEVSRNSEWFHALFGLALLLLLITLVINLSANYILRKLKERTTGPKGGSPPKPKGRIAISVAKLSPQVRRSIRIVAYSIVAILFILFLYTSMGPLGTGVIIGLGAVVYIVKDRISRKVVEKIAFGLLTAAVLTVVVIVGIILYYIISKGAPAITWEFLSQPPSDLGRSGGIYPAIIGTLYLVGGAILFAVPLGIGASIFLTEYTTEGKLTKTIRAGVDLLNGTPSIVFGLFGLAFFVLYLDWGISLLAGQVSLGLMVLPTIIRTTEEALRSVPDSLREGSLALGATKWQTIRKVVLPPATPGIITGTILSIGRAAGETAPIMFTAVVFSQRFLPDSVFDPVMALPFHLFILTTSVPGATTNQYGTALVLLMLVVSIYLIAIIMRMRFYKKMRT